METDLILGVFIGVVIVSAVIVVVLVATRRAGYRRARRLQQQKGTGVNIRRVATPESASKSRMSEKPTKRYKQDAPENVKEYNKKASSAVAPSFGRTDQADSTGLSENDEKRPGQIGGLPAAEGENAATLAEKANDEFQKQALKNENGDLTSLFTDELMEESREGKFAKKLNNVDIQDLLTQVKILVKPRKKNGS
jgi:hypothetical protein